MLILYPAGQYASAFRLIHNTSATHCILNKVSEFQKELKKATMKVSFLSLFLLVASSQGFAPTVVYPPSFVKSSLRMTAESLANQKEIKVGVIGCGRIGLVHLGAITKCPNVTPVIVSNPTVAKAEAGQFRCAVS